MGNNALPLPFPWIDDGKPDSPYSRIQQNLDALAIAVGAMGLGFMLVRGTIDSSAPSTVEGTGFSISKNATGDVTVTFSPAFSDVPTVVSDVRTSGLFDTRQPVSPTASSCRVQIFNTSTGAAADGEFYFIAIGPR